VRGFIDRPYDVPIWSSVHVGAVLLFSANQNAVTPIAATGVRAPIEIVSRSSTVRISILVGSCLDGAAFSRAPVHIPASISFLFAVTFFLSSRLQQPA
jgi:hypothetical protein